MNTNPNEWTNEEYQAHYGGGGSGLHHECDEYKYNGLCPCCGGYVRTIGGNYDNDPMHDECDTCGWKGETEYD